MGRISKGLALTAWAMAMPALAGTSALLDAVQLKEMLKKDQPCCVVDARPEVKRKLYPIAFAVVYSTNIKPKAGAYAVVIGDSDQQSLETAQTISRRSGENAYAVKGGYAAWQKVAQGDGKIPGAPTTATPQSFIIPSNTCETGPALHEYK
ncbi:MAG: rhodanese-like domain-containing protein [Glaciimonas sp.]|nr:rhodanese-like domain-containing protein [Glaciimonas sp.]